jgi:hypothetical protein
MSVEVSATKDAPKYVLYHLKLIVEVNSCPQLKGTGSELLSAYAARM